MQKTVVIVGAGQAGFQCASSLRDNGFEGRIVLIGNEKCLPYQRPPLSKSFLLGDAAQESLQFRPARFFAERDIELFLDDAGLELDSSRRSLVLRSGRHLLYDHLVLATGARNRELALAGGNQDIHYLRTALDAQKLRERLRAAVNVVVIGAGFVGLEVATALADLGKRVVVLDVMSRVMSRVVTPVTAEFFAREHLVRGVALHHKIRVTSVLTTNGKTSAVETSQGGIILADLVFVGIGVVPNTDLAEKAGLAVSDGIIVDGELKTSDPHISAIGDCARFQSSLYGGLMRIESVQNAVDQARLVASRLTRGRATYKSIPWFWSDQAGAKLQIVGLNLGWDRTVVRGKVSSGKFSVFCFKEDELVSIESVNSPLEHMLGRKVLGKTERLRSSHVLAPDFDLRSFADRP